MFTLAIMKLRKLNRIQPTEYIFELLLMTKYEQCCECINITYSLFLLNLDLLKAFSEFVEL